MRTHTKFSKCSHFCFCVAFICQLLVGNPSIQFMVYYSLKRGVHRRPFAPILQHILGENYEKSPLLHFLMGAVAKAIATLLTYPIQVVQSRMRMTAKAPVKDQDNINETLQTRGPKPGRQNGLKKRNPASSGSKENTSNSDSKKTTGRKLLSNNSFTSVLNMLLQQHGLKGLFLGIEAKMLQTVLTSSVMFVCYERFLESLRAAFPSTLSIQR